MDLRVSWLIFVVPFIFASPSLGQEPGACLSRFDYEYKMLQKIQELESEIKQLKESVNNPAKVSFMAQLSAEVENPAIGRSIVFDDVLQNHGNSYNGNNGVFVAKVPGVYMFHLTASSKPATGNHLGLYVMKNDVKVNYLFLDNNKDFWLHRSVPTVIDLETGDQVKVIFGNVIKSSTLGGCCFHTHFSGVFISKQ
ncbi:complement C1q-like protein 4 [Mya arenaria]|uniref:complement C1q-like protein 4 n=1 Tax=Mya arenaria TaxID=6604 RepID=UPI0022E2FFB0|nr:complement C1q-like protein 4 [Mya arenaria]